MSTLQGLTSPFPACIRDSTQGTRSGKQNYLVSYISERLIANLRKQLYGHIQALSLAFFNNRRTGEIMSRVTTDVTVAQNGLTTNVLTLLQQMITLVAPLSALSPPHL